MALGGEEGLEHAIELLLDFGIQAETMKVYAGV